jgi:hypothetical protein
VTDYGSVGGHVRDDPSLPRFGHSATAARRDSNALVVGVLAIMATVVALYDLALLAVNFH